MRTEAAVVEGIKPYCYQTKIKIELKSQQSWTAVLALLDLISMAHLADGMCHLKTHSTTLPLSLSACPLALASVKNWLLFVIGYVALRQWSARISYWTQLEPSSGWKIFSLRVSGRRWHHLFLIGSWVHQLFSVSIPGFQLTSHIYAN